MTTKKNTTKKTKNTAPQPVRRFRKRERKRSNLKIDVDVWWAADEYCGTDMSISDLVSDLLREKLTEEGYIKNEKKN